MTIPLYEARDFVPLSLGIGMSLHWPVIGWMFGRTLLFSLHLAVRALAIIVLGTLFHKSGSYLSRSPSRQFTC